MVIFKSHEQVTSKMVYHRGVSLSKQCIAGLMLCHGIQTMHDNRVGGGKKIPFHLIGKKYTEGTNSWPHAYNNLVYMYIEGEAWQEPLQEMYC